MKRSRTMMIAFVAALLLVAALLVACSGKVPALPKGPATKAPTSMPPSAKQQVGPSRPVSPTQAIPPTLGPAALAATPVTPTVGAVSTGTVSSAVTVTLESTSWKMVSFLDSKGQTTQALTNTEVTAQFLGGEVSGKDGCSQYAGTYKATANVLTVKLNATTMGACDAKATAQAQAYAAALGSATTYQIAGKQLQITNGAGQVAVTYVVVEGMAAAPVAPTQTVTITAVTTATLPLEGTNWQLATLPDAKGAASTPLTGTQITALFQGGQITGSAGCNSYSAAYKVSGTNLTVNPATATTTKTCGTSIMQQETAFLKALSGIAAYQIAGDKLELRNSAGAAVVSFAGPKPAAAQVAQSVPITPTIKAPAPTATVTPTVKPAATVTPTVAPALAGAQFTNTTWKWVRFVSPVEASDVASPDKYTLVFRPDGTFNVVADCNKASGVYKTVGLRMQIQLTPATLATCPSGSRSDQFIKDLETATLYFTDEGFLYIELFADSGVMKFANAGPAK
jgi:heat shock protein HslJ